MTSTTSTLPGTAPLRTRAACLVLALAAATASGATFTVTTTADSGAGSLRQAILDANTAAGTDTIVFAIPGSGPYVINPLSILPPLSQPTILDGSTQPGYAGTPIIEVSNFSSSGIRLTGGDSTVRALVVRLFNTGIDIQSNGNHVEGCFIGTDVTGTVASANGTGVAMQSGTSNNVIGGTTAAQRNLLSGNSTGVFAIAGSGNIVTGNYIGTDVTGTQPLPNLVGVTLTATTSSQVGGTAPGAGNLISGNTTTGIVTAGGSGGAIQGNLIGTDVTGTLPLPNPIGIDTATADLLIGGSADGAGNVVAAATTGLSLSGAGAIVQGNWIGTNSAADIGLGNGYGIKTLSGGTDCLIGGVGAGEGNVIAFNATAIWNQGTRNAIRGNSIYANADLGIDLGPLGVTANDALDADSGPNGLQNFPLITTVDYGASTTVNGILTSAPSATYTLDFYANPICSPRPRDFLQGQQYLGSLPVTTDGSGVGPFSAVLPAVTDGQPISATATDAQGDTSEFSQRIVFSINPVSGVPAGGTNVVLTGTNFLPGATVTFGATPATGVVVTNGTTMHVTSPPLAAGSLSDLSVSNTDGTHGTLPKAWVANFLDVPNGQQFYDWVTKLVANGITVGVGGGLYGVDQSTLRQQMAVFLLKARHGLCYVPPPCGGVFPDVACPSTFANWIEALAAEGITGGCGNGNYCPGNPVRRDQMAVFLLKAEHGPAYLPPDCTGVYPDVPCPSTFANWIERLAAEGITGGCGNGDYCPGNPNTRGQMAVFISKTFHLQ